MLQVPALVKQAHADAWLICRQALPQIRAEKADSLALKGVASGTPLDGATIRATSVPRWKKFVAAEVGVGDEIQ